MSEEEADPKCLAYWKAAKKAAELMPHIIPHYEGIVKVSKEGFVKMTPEELHRQYLAIHK